MPNESPQILQFSQTTFWYWAHLLFLIFVINPVCYLGVYFLLKKIDPSFEYKSYREKCYAIKNISKSFILCILTSYCFPMFIKIMSYDEWPSQLMIILGNVYVSTDVTALFFVPELPTNTKIHHTVVLILGIINTFANYQIDGIHRATTYLTFFSMIPYIVNTRLGVRFIEISVLNKKRISYASAAVYTLSIICNFIIQNYYIFLKSNINLVSRILYFIVYYLIFNDDILLLNYLIRSATGSSLKDRIDKVKETYFRNSNQDSDQDKNQDQ